MAYNTKTQKITTAHLAMDGKKTIVNLSHDQKMLIIKRAHAVLAKGK